MGMYKTSNRGGHKPAGCSPAVDVRTFCHIGKRMDPELKRIEAESKTVFSTKGKPVIRVPAGLSRRNIMKGGNQ